MDPDCITTGHYRGTSGVLKESPARQSFPAWSLITKISTATSCDVDTGTVRDTVGIHQRGYPLPYPRPTCMAVSSNLHGAQQPTHLH